MRLSLLFSWRIEFCRTCVCVLLVAFLAYIPATVAVEIEGTVHHWIFDTAHISDNSIKDDTGKNSIKMQGSPSFQKLGNVEFFVFDGEKEPGIIVQDKPDPAGLPKRELSISAWVRCDKTDDAGVIFGIFQDNGKAQKGWVIGYDKGVFTFGLATKGADDGDGRMTYLRSRFPFSQGDWHHLACTYDGKLMQIYVDKQAECGSAEQSGDILYPDMASYELGTRHYNNENVRMNGALREICVYDRALKPEEIILSADQQKAVTSLNKPRMIVGPYLQGSGTTGMMVLWETSEAASTIVEYGESTPLTQKAETDGLCSMHKLEMKGLHAQTIYFYRVISKTANGVALASDTCSFQTPVAPDTPFAFSFVSDTQGSPNQVKIFSGFLLAQRPLFCIHAGDIHPGGVPEHIRDWQDNFLQPFAPFIQRIPLYMVPGNHESSPATQTFYRQYNATAKDKTYYTFTYGNAQFFMIDTNEPCSPESDQYKWLAGELSKSTATWKFAVQHHPPYSSEATYSKHLGEERCRPLAQLYEAHGVDIVFCGHSHLYERTWPIKEGRSVPDGTGGVVYIINVSGGHSEEYMPTRSWLTAKTDRGWHIGMVTVNGKDLRLSVYDVFNNNSISDWLELHKQ